jgi:hypothetical protein
MHKRKSGKAWVWWGLILTLLQVLSDNGGEACNAIHFGILPCFFCLTHFKEHYTLFFFYKIQLQEAFKQL